MRLMRVIAAALALLPAASAGAGSFTLSFDLLTPAAMACTAEAPGAAIRAGRGIAGTPRLTITGDLTGARVTCTAPDGSRWTIDLPRDSRDPLAAETQGVAAWRPGSARMPLYISTAERFSQMHRFTRID